MTVKNGQNSLHRKVLLSVKSSDLENVKRTGEVIIPASPVLF